VATQRKLADRLGEVRLVQAMLYLELGDLRTARRHLRAARPATGVQFDAEWHLADGMIALRSGDVLAAIAAWQRAVDLSAELADAIRFKAMSNLGSALTEVGRLRDAHTYLQRAAEISVSLGELCQAGATHNLGWILMRQGRLAAALERFQEAEAIAVRARIPLAQARVDQMHALEMAGLWDEAGQRLDALLSMLASPGTALLRAEVLLHRATIDCRQGEWAQALSHSAQAEELFRAQHQPLRRAAALVRRGQAAVGGDCLDETIVSEIRHAATLLTRRGEVSTAVEGQLVLGLALAQIGRRSSAQKAWRSCASLARSGPVLMRVQGHLADALASDERAARLRACRRGLDELDRYRAALSSAELRAYAVAHGLDLVEIGMGLARSGRQTFEWLERARATTAIGLGSVSDDPRLNADLSELRTMTTTVLERTEASEAAEVALLRQQRTLEERIRRQAWSVADGHRTTVRTGAGEVLKHLGEHCLVSYGVLAGRAVAVKLYRGRVTRHDLGPADSILNSVAALQYSARRLASPGRAGAARAVIESCLRELDTALVSHAPDAPIVIVPPGQLHAVPWGSLPSLVDRPVAVSPSAALWVRSLAAPAADGAPVLVAGPRLPHALDEVAMLGELYQHCTSFSPSDASCQKVCAALDGAPLGHLACHGHLRSDSPMFCSLELADGSLNLYDIDRLRNTPRRVVLSACDVGLMALRPGQDALGFASAFLARETAGIVAATIPVPDVETAPLMLSLHRRLLKGDSLPEALQQARSSVDTSSPEGLAASLAFTCFGAG